jgi:hypothetical protein
LRAGRARGRDGSGDVAAARRKLLVMARRLRDPDPAAPTRVPSRGRTLSGFGTSRRLPAGRFRAKPSPPASRSGRGERRTSSSAISPSQVREPHEGGGGVLAFAEHLFHRDADELVRAARITVLGTPRADREDRRAHSLRAEARGAGGGTTASSPSSACVSSSAAVSTCRATSKSWRVRGSLIL